MAMISLVDLKHGLLHANIKKTLTIYVKLLRHTDQAINKKCGWLLQDCVSSQAPPAKCQPIQYKVSHIVFYYIVHPALLLKTHKVEEEKKGGLSPGHCASSILSWWTNSKHKWATYLYPSFCLQYFAIISFTMTKLQKYFQGNDKPQSRIQLSVLGIQINSARCLVQGTEYSTFK